MIRHAIYEKVAPQKQLKLESLFRRAMLWDVNMDSLSIKHDKENLTYRKTAETWQTRLFSKES